MKRLIIILFIINIYNISYSQFYQNWVARWNGPLNGYDRPYSMTIDLSGNVFVTGQANFSYYSDMTTIKYPGT